MIFHVSSMRSFTPINPNLAQHYFLQNDVLAQCPYTIECIYSDNGREYQDTCEYLFVKTCNNHPINQKFTKPACQQTNRKAERVIRTLMAMWHNLQIFEDSKDRQQKLKRFINYYNMVKPHKAISEKTSYEF